ncbi:hypothetical protein [Rubrivivax gelatinosus]|uniref:Uncharacterized protein n=1 Tax=Rubrivivax gelatinosus TaxID=28068 RepID=A0ABS1DUT5_RUBGE|nr:hypothetical protein [Rubrivivax gelatinosus]MBK1713797.1 hypothetical protein [Rubrivivax gelatinosus]
MKTERRAAAAAVLAAHALLLAGLASLLPPRERQVAAPASVSWLRLLTDSPKPQPDAPPGRERPRLPAAPARSAQLALQAPAAAALPSAATPAAEPAAPAPLLLTLPRGGAARVERSPALDDARANTPRPNLETRIAKTLEKDWTEELLPDGSRRYRRGTDCVVVKDSRIAVLDPFSLVARNARMAGYC